MTLRPRGYAVLRRHGFSLGDAFGIRLSAPQNDNDRTLYVSNITQKFLDDHSN